MPDLLSSTDTSHVDGEGQITAHISLLKITQNVFQILVTATGILQVLAKQFFLDYQNSFKKYVSKCWQGHYVHRLPRERGNLSTERHSSSVMVSPSDDSRKDECDWFASVTSHLGEFPGNESGERSTFSCLLSHQTGDFGSSWYVCHVLGLEWTWAATSGWFHQLSLTASRQRDILKRL